MLSLHRQAVALVALGALMAGCGVAPEPGDEGDSYVDPVTGKAEGWNSANDPSKFEALGLTFIRNYDELHGGDVARFERDGSPRLDEDGNPVMVSLTEATSEILPWPASYWPMKDDGYNNRWQGSDELSPMEKYDKIYNGWSPAEDFMELRPFSSPGAEFDSAYYEQLGPAASWAHSSGGNADAVNHTRDPEDPEDDGWGGLEGWFGHCHAWAPVAISEPEPLHAVEKDGVRFEVSDIKALIMSQYEGMRSVFLGGRCNDKEIERDEHGRISDAPVDWWSGGTETACRDTNPGAFHVVMVNMLGRYGRSFVIDASMGYQVWNHPVLGYRITEQRKIADAQEAMSLLPGSPTGESYRYNDAAVSFAHVEVSFDYIRESSYSTQPMTPNLSSYTSTKTYEYLLELDGDGNIIGGEWISNNSFPDFMWAPMGHGHVSQVDYDTVKELVEESRVSE